MRHAVMLHFNQYSDVNCNLFATRTSVIPIRLIVFEVGNKNIIAIANKCGETSLGKSRAANKIRDVCRSSRAVGHGWAARRGYIDHAFSALIDALPPIST